ncbi:MAG: hypothetical protein NWS09_00040, partial [Schleiferiaceae bacterium]|nr:hypothetical protein [Schleiferiaceae bacterium]
MKRIISLCTWVAMALPVLAQGNLDFSLGNGLTAASADGQYRMAMGGSVQLLGTSVWDAQGRGLQAYPSLGFLRLQGSARPESVEFLVQLNFAQATPLLDAWVRHTTRWGSRITVGQMQNIGNGLEMLVFEDLQAAPMRSLAAQTFSRSGREAGVMLDHRVAKDRWGMGAYAQVTSGDGQNSFGADSRDVDLGGLKYSGRVELSLGTPRKERAPVQLASFDRKTRLLLGLSGSYNRGASQAVGEGHGSFQMYRGSDAAFPDYRKWSADVLATKGGLSVYGQMMYATATNLDGLQWTPSVSNLLRPQEISRVLHLGRAFTGQVEYVHPSRWALVGRRSLVLPEFGDHTGSLIEAASESLLGINRYVVEHQVKWFVGIQR